MDSLFAPTALYLILAVSVALSAKGTAERVKGHSPIKPWEPWLFQAPVLVAFLHLFGYVTFQLFFFEQIPSISSRVNLIAHWLTIMLAGFAGAWNFARQLDRVRSDSMAP